jgi:hypothetical protein
MKHAKPWFRKSKNSWYVELGGKQKLLGRYPEGPLFRGPRGKKPFYAAGDLFPISPVTGKTPVLEKRHRLCVPPLLRAGWTH